MVVLKNISEKPEECRGCRFHDKEGDCYLLPESRSYETYAEQYEHCPIEESPQVIRCRDCGWWEKQAYLSASLIQKTAASEPGRTTVPVLTMWS